MMKNNIAKKAYKMSSVNADGVEKNERSIEIIKRQIGAIHTHSNKNILDQTTASFLTSEKQKLAGIEEMANKNVQANWNESDSTKDSFIQNKPSIPIVDATLSSQSENAIQNKAVQNAIDGEINTRASADASIENKIDNHLSGYGRLADMNTIIQANKSFWYENTTANQPNGEAFWGTVIYFCGEGNASWITQFVFPNELKYYYKREYVNGSWRGWRQISTMTDYTVLYSGNSNGTNTCEDITHFKYLLTSFKDNNGEWQSTLFPAEIVAGEILGQGNFYINTNTNNPNEYKYGNFNFTSTTQFEAQVYNIQWLYLRGIK